MDVGLRDVDGRWLAVADVADEPGGGTGEDSRESQRESLMALGPRASRRAGSPRRPRWGPGPGAAHQPYRAKMM